MNIVLTGFMGTGKTAVGRRLAERLRVPFEDVDAAITKEAGRSIADIFAVEGEERFRKLEAAVIQRLAAADRTVIATGGGALFHPGNRAALARNGILVCLTAKLGTLLERLRDDVTRPLLAGEDMEKRLERLMKERQAVYAECPIQIPTDGRTIDDVTDCIISRITPQWAAA
ncbi:MAG TPA: shikimate kinase [Elusimicrobiota bacterium]|nr:shikimate kinase [Elusimicrobiota bacterium]